MSGYVIPAISAASSRRDAESPTSVFSDLHALVLRSAATLRRNPVDHLVGIHDVAGLAVNAVGGIDLQPLPALAGVHHFVDIGRAEPQAGVAVLLAAAGRTDVRIVHDQMRGLVLRMA